MNWFGVNLDGITWNPGNGGYGGRGQSSLAPLVATFRAIQNFLEFFRVTGIFGVYDKTKPNGA